MGSSLTGDKFNRRYDEAVLDIINLQKVIDDVILYNETFEEHYNNVRKYLQRYRDHNTTLNRNKFRFAVEDVKFVGYKIIIERVATDPAKFQAINKFSEPDYLSQVKPFLGMVNKMVKFSSDISAADTPLREVLQSKNEYMRQPMHSDSFNSVKTALSLPPKLTNFNRKLKTRLQTDASRANGLGYILEPNYIDTNENFYNASRNSYLMLKGDTPQLS